MEEEAELENLEAYYFNRSVLLLHGAAGSRDVWKGLDANGGGDINRQSVCFPVTVLGATHTVRGTLVTSSGYDDDDFGFGDNPSEAPAPDASAVLAKRGYGVFIVDRLGYGASPYAGSGFALNLDAQAEATHQIVQRIKSGAYKCPGDKSKSYASTSVFVGGQSLGALIVELYATRYGSEADGIISTGTSTFGLGVTLITLFNTHILPQIQAGNDYFTLFPYANGFSQECVDGVFYTPGASSSIVQAVCSQNGPGTIIDGLTPSGDFLSAFDANAEIQANTGNVQSPVLFVLADEDAFVPGAAGGPSGTEPNLQAAEVNHWNSNCNCEVSTTSGGNHSGHLWQFHLQAHSLLGQTADWLDAH